MAVEFVKAFLNKANMRFCKKKKDCITYKKNDCVNRYISIIKATF